MKDKLKRKTSIINKKKSYFLLITIVLIIASFAGTLHYLRWSTIAQTHMADFDGDNESELLIVYDNYFYKSGMKLLDIKTGKTIWRTLVYSNEKRNLASAYRPILVINGALVICYKGASGKPDGLIGFQSETGREIWNHEFESMFNTGFDSDLIRYGKNFILIDNNHLWLISPASGKILWDTDLKIALSNITEVVKNKGLIVRGLVNEMFVDLKRKTVYENSDNFSQLIVLEDSLLLYNGGYKTESQDSSEAFLSFYNLIDYRLIMHNLANYWKYDHCSKLFYNKKLFIFNEYDNPIEVIEIPIDSKATINSSYSFDDELENVVLPSERIRNSFSRTRYIPILGYKKINDSIYSAHILIFDIDNTQITWKSKKFNLHNNDLYYNIGLSSLNCNYSISFNLKKDKSLIKPCHLTFNGETGKFVNAKYFTDDDIFTYYYDHNKNLFYGHTKDYVAVFDYPGFKILYSSKSNLKSVEGKKEVENLLGEMPWSN